MMAAPSPTLAGLRHIVRQPAAGFTEILWRWASGLFGLSLLAFLAVEYVKSLPLNSVDLLMLRSGQWWLIARALSHILGGSAPRLVSAAGIVLLACTVVWIVLASVGRAASLKMLLRDSPASDRADGKLRPLLGLNLLRAIALYAAVLSKVGVLIVAARVASPTPGSVNAVFSLALWLALLIFFFWYLINWFLSLAPIFVVRDGRSMSAALGDAASFCTRHLGPVLAVTSLFSLFHLALWMGASVLSLVPAAFLGTLPVAVIVGWLFLLTLMYFAVVDYLYVARLAAYLAIVDTPSGASEAVREEPPSADPPLRTTVPAPGLFPAPDFSAQP
ncbi:MAG: hypothetical protein H0X25_19530 [Acidobacteriales bacterium]|nr:hypothetical protein [Terriglobales bacterium]